MKKLKILKMILSDIKFNHDNFLWFSVCKALASNSYALNLEFIYKDLGITYNTNETNLTSHALCVDHLNRLIKNEKNKLIKKNKKKGIIRKNYT